MRHRFLRSQKFGEIGPSVDGYRIVRSQLENGAGVQVPALVFEPFSPAGRKPAVLYRIPKEKARTPLQAETSRRWRGRDILCWLLICAAGEKPRRSAVIPALRPLSLVDARYARWPYRCRNQTTDLLAAFDYLASRADVGLEPHRRIFQGKCRSGCDACRCAGTADSSGRVRGRPSFLPGHCRARFHGEIADIAIPGVLEQFDLPDVAAAIAPRKLWLVDPMMPSGSPELLGKVTPEYQSAERAWMPAFMGKKTSTLQLVRKDGRLRMCMENG